MKEIYWVWYYYNIQTVFSNLKNSVNHLYYSGGSDGKDFGDTLLDIAQFDELQVKNLALIETTQLGTGSTDCKIDCLLMLLGFHQAMERFFTQ